MSFDINTNVASLQAQNFLRINSNFQNQTINEVTSGLRIVQSGDDAAGLAIANGYRSDQAVLTQGVQNANDGLSQLQIIDGGMNNISQLLDRARTLATESATGTFTGDRTVLNNEFQSVLGEIDRQSQAIGLNQGGTFAKNLTVFIGGGQGPTAAAAITNGSVSLDLSYSTVDSQSLGLKGFTSGHQVAAGAADSGLYDLGNSSTTSVSKIIANTGATSTSFVISGPGFATGAGGAITVTANLQNVGDGASLVNAINAGIQAASQAGTAQAGAFNAANIAATIHTGADGHQQLVFTSANTAFNVTAGDVTANGLMGNLTGQNNPGDDNATSPAPSAIAADSAFVGGGTQQYSVAFTTMVHNATAGSQDVQYLTVSANSSDGTPQTVKIKLDAGATTDLTSALAIGQINQQLQATDNPALQSIVASTDGAGHGYHLVEQWDDAVHGKHGRDGRRRRDGCARYGQSQHHSDDGRRRSRQHGRYQHAGGGAGRRRGARELHRRTGQRPGGGRQGREPVQLRHQPGAIAVDQFRHGGSEHPGCRHGQGSR